jgi:hypothetical protein
MSDIANIRGAFKSTIVLKDDRNIDVQAAALQVSIDKRYKEPVDLALSNHDSEIVNLKAKDVLTDVSLNALTAKDASQDAMIIPSLLNTYVAREAAAFPLVNGAAVQPLTATVVYGDGSFVTNTGGALDINIADVGLFTYTWTGDLTKPVAGNIFSVDFVCTAAGAAVSWQVQGRDQLRTSAVAETLSFGVTGYFMKNSSAVTRIQLDVTMWEQTVGSVSSVNTHSVIIRKLG